MCHFCPYKALQAAAILAPFHSRSKLPVAFASKECSGVRNKRKRFCTQRAKTPLWKYLKMAVAANSLLSANNQKYPRNYSLNLCIIDSHNSDVCSGCLLSITLKNGEDNWPNKERGNGHLS